ncbi:MAG: gamma-glutamyl-gamma-aminobutyrate hydrolase family protein [Paracoccaceae bacterium]|nr:gamma-glutamyl-gamma-aminobutyrate hydrolase family protein [Paracoccaceae bacterium]MDE2915272.1 gamma-glutamyl-gamma-aminobutyrate hydrolase family protein [Paracoccaceae bacterium]
MTTHRPVVGVSGNGYLIDGEYPVQASGDHNLEAIADVTGAMTVILPSIPEINGVADVLRICDGFVFTGGRPNVHPEEYGEQPTAAHGHFDRRRDRVALPLIRAAVDAGKPVLGICRGFQEMNVAFGGTLHPEIRDLPGRINHRMPPDGTMAEKFALRHEVTLKDEGMFARIFGSNRVMTNSLHGQGIKSPGERIVVEGWAPDGTEEAIRVRNAPGFALAVQWHPEWNANDDPVSRRLYEAFGRALRGLAID